MYGKWTPINLSDHIGQQITYNRHLSRRKFDDGNDIWYFRPENFDVNFIITKAAKDRMFKFRVEADYYVNQHKTVTIRGYGDTRREAFKDFRKQVQYTFEAASAFKLNESNVPHKDFTDLLGELRSIHQTLAKLEGRWKRCRNPETPTYKKYAIDHQTLLDRSAEIGAILSMSYHHAVTR